MARHRQLKRGALVVLVVAGGLLAYLSLWPVPFDPVSWSTSKDPGYTGVFAQNSALAAITRIDTGHGPEDIAVRDGQIYVSSEDGQIQRVDPVTKQVTPWTNTQGRPLGIEFDAQGTLWVADGHRGLLRVDAAGAVEVVCDAVDGVPLRYADDVDIAADGRVFFSDASTHFSAQEWTTLGASFLAILEHGSDGRLLVYEPSTQACRQLLGGLDFPNGVAVAADQSFVAFAETSAYRVRKYHLTGPQAGQTSVLIEGLPAFPDNVARAPDGGFWVGLIAPRDGVVDALSELPFLRKMVWRLPDFVRPKPKRYPHLIKVDLNGAVVANLQDPAGGYPMATGALELNGTLYITSLTTPALGLLPWP